MKVNDQVFYFDKLGRGHKALILKINKDSIDLIYSLVGDIEKIITRIKQETKIKSKDEKLLKETNRRDQLKIRKNKKILRHCITVKNVIPKEKAKVVQFKPGTEKSNRPILWNAKIKCYKLVGT